MIYLKIAYNDNSEDLVKELEKLIPSKYPSVNLESFHENLFKERKKAFKLKGGYSARKSPFAILADVDNNPISVFYSESNDCTLNKIEEVLNNFVVYGQNS